MEILYRYVNQANGKWLGTAAQIVGDMVDAYGLVLGATSGGAGYDLQQRADG